MGNGSQRLPFFRLDNGSWGQLPTSQSSQFIIREVVAHSAEQHQELVVQLSKFKQYRCAQLVQLVDSHTLQANNLCSVIVHTYAVMLRPKYTLQKYLQHLHATNMTFCNKLLNKMLSDLIKALSFLKQEGNEAYRVNEDQIFIDQDQNGEINVKLMNPFFMEQSYDSEQGKGAICDIGQILKKYVRFQFHSQELIQNIQRMANASISLQQLQEKYVGKKGKVKLKLTKNHIKEGYDRTSRAQRESVASVVSNSSSLLIEAGDTSDFALKDFYQNLQGEISNIAEVYCPQPLLTSYTLQQFNISHQFPKKYVKGKAFRKAMRTMESQDYSSAYSQQKQPITRDQSLKENLRVESKQILLQSAKLVHSFIADAEA